ncbi:MAG TPA: hypothetical protein VKR23_00395 [Gaiellaceae bacterium]|nr:hypothetical protein [Gaiellaceae bacterium]
MSGLSAAEFYGGGGLTAELPGGSLVLGATHQRGKELSVVLRRVDSACHVVHSFGKDGTAALALSVETGPYGFVGGSIDTLAAEPDGGLLVAGNDGRYELVGRLLATGRLDPSFGRNGWARIRPHEKPAYRTPPPFPTVTSIAIDPSGSIFLGGNDGEAHCCAQSFVSELTADGAPVQSFGSNGSIILPARGFTGSYITQLASNGDGSAYAFGEYEQSGCGYPIVVRFGHDGSLDARFDAAVARTLRRVAPQPFRFTPTLVPGSSGAFALVGGFDKTCGPLSRHPVSSGRAVGILPSGRIDGAFGKAGESPFAAPVFTFDNPLAIRLASGGIVAADELYDGKGRLKRVSVQSFASDGSADGRRTIVRARLPHKPYLAGLLPAPADEAWLVIGSRSEIELLPVG